MYHYKECGLDNVQLVNGYEITVDPVYGECISIEDGRGLHELLGMTIANQPAALSSAEFTFLRKLMNQSQATLALFFGVSEQTIARYEKGQAKIPRTTDVCLRALYLDARNRSGRVPELLKKVAELEAELYHAKPRKKPVLKITKPDGAGWKIAA